MIKSFRQKISILLIASMLACSCPVNAFADEIIQKNPDSGMATISETASKSEALTAADEADNIEIASLSEEAVLLESDPVDGVVVSVKAEAGVLPEGAKLVVKKVACTDSDMEDIEAAVDNTKLFDNEINTDETIERYTFDITILDKNGTEIQPDGEVEIKFSLIGSKQPVKGARVFHVGDLEKEACEELEKLAEEYEEKKESEDDFEFPDGIIYNDLSSNIRNKSAYIETEEEEESIIKDTPFYAAELEVTGEANEAIAVTDGFSYYVVEFEYQTLKYVLEGGDMVAVKDILDVLQIPMIDSADNPHEITAATTSNASLFIVEKNESGEWMVISVNPFTSKETLSVTVGTVEYVIEVTDEQDYVVQNITKEDQPKYTTLQSAIDAAASGDTLKILNNFTLSAGVKVTQKMLYIDLNEKKISHTNEWEKIFTVNGSSGNVIFNGVGEIESTGEGSTLFLKNGGSSISYDMSRLVVVDGSFDAESSRVVFAEKPSQITLTFLDGTTVIDTIKATPNELLPDVTVPEKLGYAFAGYYHTRDGVETQYYGANGKGLVNCPFTTDTELYAKWTEGYEARIGEISYNTLAEAIAAVKKDGIIEVLRSVTIPEEGISLDSDVKYAIMTVNGRSDIDVTGGPLNVTNGIVNLALCGDNNNNIAVSETGTVIIMAGTYSGNLSGNIEIENGFFNGASFSSGVKAKGGYYTSAAISSYLYDTDQYECVDSGLESYPYMVTVKSGYAVAKVEDEAKTKVFYYASIKQALAAVSENDIVTLLSDTSINETLYIETPITLDLGIYTISVTGTTPALRITNGNVTIKGESIENSRGTIALSATTKSTGIQTSADSLTLDGVKVSVNVSRYQGIGVTVESGDLTLTNFAEIKVNSFTESCGIQNNGGTLKVKDSTVSVKNTGRADSYAIQSANTVILDGADVTSDVSEGRRSYAVTITGGTLTVSNHSHIKAKGNVSAYTDSKGINYDSDSTGSTITESSVDATGDLDDQSRAIMASKGVITIKSGWFACTSGALFSSNDDCIRCQGGYFSDDISKHMVDVQHTYLDPVNYICRLNQGENKQEYPYLVESKSNNEARLIEPNGNKTEYSSLALAIAAMEEKASVSEVHDGYVVELLNNVGTAETKTIPSLPHVIAYTIDWAGFTFTSTNPNTIIFQGHPDEESHDKNTTVTIKNGTIKVNTESPSTVLTNYGNLIAENMTVDPGSNGQVTVVNNKLGSTVINECTVKANSGYVEGTEKNTVVKSEGGIVSINDGHYFGRLATGSEAGRIEITAGFFNDNVSYEANKHLAAGYGWAANTGVDYAAYPYKVVEDSKRYAVKIERAGGAVLFENVSQAIKGREGVSGASSGETIILLADTEEKDTLEFKGFNLDLNGRSITSSNPIGIKIVTGNAIIKDGILYFIGNANDIHGIDVASGTQLTLNNVNVDLSSAHGTSTNTGILNDGITLVRNSSFVFNNIKSGCIASGIRNNAGTLVDISNSTMRMSSAAEGCSGMIGIQNTNSSISPLSEIRINAVDITMNASAATDLNAVHNSSNANITIQGNNEFNIRLDSNTGGVYGIHHVAGLLDIKSGSKIIIKRSGATASGKTFGISSGAAKDSFKIESIGIDVDAPNSTVQGIAVDSGNVTITNRVEINVTGGKGTIGLYANGSNQSNLSTAVVSINSPYMESCCINVSNESGLVNILDGYFKNIDEYENVYDYNKDLTNGLVRQHVRISGGYFSSDLDKNLIVGGKTTYVTDPGFQAQGYYYMVGDAKWVVKNLQKEQEHGEEYTYKYMTLYGAIKAAESGDELELLRDITEQERIGYGGKVTFDKHLSLDLAGSSILVDTGQELFEVNEIGALTIKDKGTPSQTYSERHEGVISNPNGPILCSTGGSILVEDGGFVYSPSKQFYIGSAVDLTITGGEFSAKGNIANYFPKEGTTSIKKFSANAVEDISYRKLCPFKVKKSPMGDYTTQVEAVTIYSSTTTPTGKIEYNVYVYFPTDMLKYKDYYGAGITYDGGNSQWIPISSGTPAATTKQPGRYKFTVQVPIKEMVNGITIAIKDDPNVADNTYVSATKKDSEGKPYSVSRYYHDVLKLTEGDLSYQPVAHAGINTGGYAQQFFKYKTDNLANEDLGSGIYADYPKDLQQAGAPEVKDPSWDLYRIEGTTPSEFKWEGAGLELEGGINIRYYFSCESQDPKSVYEFTTKKGTKPEPQKDGETGFWFVEYEGVSAANMGVDYWVSVKEKNGSDDETQTMHYSGLSYVYAKYPESTSDTGDLSNLMRALYLYYRKARDKAEGKTA